MGHKKQEQEMVRKGGLEPPRSCERQPLKLVRLPIPPLPQKGSLLSAVQSRRDSRRLANQGLRATDNGRIYFFGA